MIFKHKGVIYSLVTFTVRGDKLISFTVNELMISIPDRL